MFSTYRELAAMRAIILAAGLAISWGTPRLDERL